MIVMTRMTVQSIYPQFPGTAPSFEIIEIDARDMVLRTSDAKESAESRWRRVDTP